MDEGAVRFNGRHRVKASYLTGALALDDI